VLRGYALDYNGSPRQVSHSGESLLLSLEDRTARLTVLVDPRTRLLFKRLCAEEDSTPSQVVRRLIRRYIEQYTGVLSSLSDDGSGPARVELRRFG